VRGLARAVGAVAILLALAAPARAQAIARFSLRAGEATFHVRATVVSDFTGRAAVSDAAYTGADLASVVGSVELRVADMRTGNGLRDRHLRAAMEADRFPLLRFDLTGVEAGAPRGDTVDLALVGRLTIHGTTREVHVPGSAIVGTDSLAVRAAFPIDMRDYGVTPPVKMLGLLRVAPGVEVAIHLVFGPAPAAPED
jgi:polyisoprenoid-binding protein YceI